MLAGVSVECYVRLERGNIGRVSESVLAAVSSALRLDEAERSHLHDLARTASTSPARAPRASGRQPVRPQVQWLLESMSGTAAYVRNACTDLLAANSLGRALHAPIFEMAGRPNTAPFVFLDPVAQDFFVVWPKVAGECAALLRRCPRKGMDSARLGSRDRWWRPLQEGGRACPDDGGIASTRCSPCLPPGGRRWCHGVVGRETRMTSTPTSTGPEVRHKGAILAIILVSYFMILLDNSVIFTALPSLEAELHLSLAELAWVQDAYTLVFGGLLLLGARAGDLLGRKRVFIFGLVVFSVASLLIAAAPAGWWIITARAIQGVGAAIVAPSALALLTASFEGRERSRAVAWYAATAGIGASLGMVVGGALASWVSWRAGFFVNVPIGAAMILLAPRFLPETDPQPGRFDLLGAITSTLGVGSLVFAILRGSELSWSDAASITGVVVAVAALTVFVVAEARATQPIMPLHLFASRERTGAYLTRLFFLAGMIGFFYFTTQYLQGVLGFTPLQAGLAFLPMTMVNFGVASAIPQVTERVGNLVPLVAGIALTVGGMFWLSQIAPGSAYLTAVALPMVLIGAGQGLAFAPMTTFGLAGTTAKDAGAASGVINTFHQVGLSLGLGILVAVAATATTGTAQATAAARLTSEVSAAILGASAMIMLALLSTLTLIVPAATAGRASVTPRRAVPVRVES